MGRKAILVLLGMALWAAGFAQGLEITGYVYEDLAPLGGNSGEDRPIPGAEVYLFWDANGTGVLDPGDKECASTVTDGTGHFSLSPSGCGSDLLFVAVDSRSLISSRRLEPGYSEDDIWAEETYQSVYDEDLRSWPTVKMFGGRDPEVSDDFANEVYEHWVTVDLKVYNEFGRSDLLFGFSFEVIVNTRDVDEDGTSGTGRSAQGTLRQFLENARAISGPDRSYFVLAHGPGYSRTIRVDPDLWMNCGGGYNRKAHPSYGITGDYTHLDGRVLDWDLTPTGEVVLLDSRDLPDDAMTILLSAAHVTVENLEFMGNRSISPDTPNRGIRMSGANYCTIQDLVIHDFHLGIELYWSSHHNLIQRVESYNNNHSGIYFQDYWARSSYNEIRNCYLHDNDINGIGFAWDNDYSTISGNVVEDNGYAGIWIGYACDHNTIQDNVVRGNKISGILLASWPSYPSAEYNEVVGNLVEENGGATTGPYGDVGYGTGIGLYNADNNIVRGNVIRDNVSGDITVYGVAIDAGSTGNTVSENEITGNGVGVAVIDSKSYGNVISRNSLYKNAGLGIDLGADGVTPNDGALGSPNRGVDYPVITRARTNPDGTIYVEGFVGPENTGGSNAFAGATVEIFLVTNGINGDDHTGNAYGGKTYGEGWKYLGSLTVGSAGSFAGTVGPLGVPIGPELLLSGTTTLSGAGTSEFGPTLNACFPHDLTGDCALGLDDVRLVHLMVKGCIPWDPRADIDGDGDVDMDDVSKYAEFFLGGD